MRDRATFQLRRCESASGHLRRKGHGGHRSIRSPVELRIGCVGYSYDFWVGPFYPKHTSPSEYLRLFAKVFDLVEIDSSFYSIPSPVTARQWRESVPPGFVFTAKFPREVTHEPLSNRSEEVLQRFLRAMEELRPQVGPLLLQFPPSLTRSAGRRTVERLLDGLPSGFDYALEFRHDSWMHPDLFADLRTRRIALAWTEVQYVETSPELTTDFVYLRFIGDRSLETLGSIQIDRTSAMEKWAARLRAAEGRVRRAYVLFNNHFAGFGPASVNEFRRILGLPPRDFTAVHAPEPGQTRLAEYE